MDRLTLFELKQLLIARVNDLNYGNKNCLILIQEVLVEFEKRRQVENTAEVPR